MPETDLTSAYREFMEDLKREAETTGNPIYSTFFENYSSLAAENGDCVDLTYAPARREGRDGYQIDGYAFEPETAELHLGICDLRNGEQPESLHVDEISRHFARAHKFCEKAVRPDFISSLEEASPAFDAAYEIYRCHTQIRRIRAVLFSDAVRSTRSKRVQSGKTIGRPITYNVLDFRRYNDLLMARGEPEPISLDISELNGTPLPCLEAHVSGEDYRSYLLVMPAELLAQIYGRYGARLLEQNVRTFLQARTKVNRGIIETLREAPEMFFAYNNGLTATASAVEFDETENGLAIRSFRDLQIVNGGQTTASILYARDQHDAPLDAAFVQMKLSVVSPEHMKEIVPKISRFANTQNRISEADFFSGDAFHQELERLSRRITAPAVDGAMAGTKWFYERARGQYRNSIAYASAAERQAFEAKFPKNQVIVKTDLAKYETTYRCEPHKARLGAQKCFLEFSERIQTEWDADPKQFDEDYFRDAVAKAILFRWTDRMVGTSDWYKQDRGHKAEIVTYTVAWLVHNMYRMGQLEIDLRRIWNIQTLPDGLQVRLARVALNVAKAIKDTPPGSRNIGEYCKKQECWDRIRDLDFDQLRKPVSRFPGDSTA